MAVPRSPSAFNFFFSSRWQRRAKAGGGAPKVDSATQRLLEGIDEVLEPFDAPDHLTKYLKDDLEKAFDIKGPPRPIYEPGKVRPIQFNLVDFVTDPLETTWKTVKKTFEPKFSALLYTPDNFVSDVDKAVWEHLYTKVWVDAAGKGVVPDSLQFTVALWNESKAKGNPRILRHVAAQGVRDNPGMIAMQARRVELHYAQLAGATYDAGAIAKQERFRDLYLQAQGFENRLSKSLDGAKYWKEAGDKFARGRKIGEARKAWGKADELWRDADEIRDEWNKKGELKDVRSESAEEFASLSKKGGPLYNSPEAQFTRFWESRNHHYAALQFLRTYKEDGFWGVVQWYGWKQITLKYKYFYTTYLHHRVQDLAFKIGVTKLLGRVQNLQTLIGRLRAANIVKQTLKKAGGWLIKKLGLAPLIGSILGSVLPGVGTVVGAVVGAVVQFAVEIVVEKIKKPLGGVLKILGYAVVGVLGAVVLFGIGIVVLIAIILSNKPYPWEAVVASGAIDCNQAATATDSCVLSKAVVKEVADRWSPKVNPGENHVNECYNDVIAKASAAGVDPRIAMAVWMHEINASNYALTERLGVLPEDFGIPAQKGKGFTVQINSFLNFYKTSQTTDPACYAGQSKAAGLFRAFCTFGKPEMGTCSSLTPKGEGCVASYFFAYSTVNNNCAVK